MRILYITTVGITLTFFENIIKKLLDDGHTVNIATNETKYKIPDCYKNFNCKVFHISTSRSPFSFGNIKAIKQIKKIAKDYDIVHCHTPIAGAVTRIGCRKLRKTQNLKVIYTAHGFHFYKGAPKLNWMLFYPIEKYCARWTDTLIVINTEDLEFAKRKLRKAKEIKYVPGVGIDLKKYRDVSIDATAKKKEIGVPADSKVVLSVGELNKNKNHQLIIKALGRISNSNIHYVIAGVGDQKDFLIKLAKDNNVNLHLLGFRKDIRELMRIADLYVHPSFREGLPVALMEAIASQVDAVCSNIRGSSDLVKNGLFSPKSVQEAQTCVESFLLGNNSNKKENYERISSFSVDKVNDDIYKVYGIK